jgi:DNA-binding transcriptional LysR family regulator
LSSLLVFTEVARKRSFTKAAQKLGMSKSAVSQHIQRLEAQIGVQLLHRNTRGMSLTASGEKLFSRGAILRDQVDLAFQELTSEEDAPSGLFSVTFPFFLEREVAVPALKQLSVEYPRLELRVEVTDTPLDLIEEELDVALFGGELRDSNYRSQMLASVTEALFASPEYVQRFGLPSSLEALDAHRWITTTWQSQRISLYRCDDANDKNPLAEITAKPFASCNSLSGVLSMVEQGMGIALLPKTIGYRLSRERKILPLLEAYRSKIWRFHFVHPYQGRKPQHVLRFQQLVKHYFSTFDDAS